MSMSIWRLCAAGALSGAALVSASTLLGACASDESGATLDADAAVSVPSAPDSAPPDEDAEAGPCTADDCEFFPDECTADALCPNGPFDPVNPDRGMDWRTRINVIRGRSASDVWLAGAVGAMAHFDGTSWSISDVGTKETQRVLWLRGAGAGEVAFGSFQNVYTRGIGGGDADAAVSAGGWSVRDMPRAPDDFGFALRASWGAPGSESLWLATDSTLWRMSLTPDSTFEILPGIPSGACGVLRCNQILAIHGASEETIWAVGEHGTALRITDADADEPVATPFNSLTHVGLTAVWAASDTDVWAVGGTGTIRHYTGDAVRWEVVPNVPTTENLNAVWGTSSSDVWVAGNGGLVLHFDGTSWSRLKIAGLGARRPDLLTIWSPGPGKVWIGGYGVLLALGGNP